MDIAARNGVDQRGVVAPGCVGTDLPELDAVEREVFRFPVGVSIVDDEIGVHAEEVIRTAILILPVWWAMEIPPASRIWRGGM